MKMKEKLERALHTRRFIRPVVGALLLAAPLASHAETLMMPDRDALAGEDVVIWGVTDQAGNYTLDCGNGDTTTLPVTDGSYIAKVCNYTPPAPGLTYEAKLTVGAEEATADLAVFTGGPELSAEDRRGLEINMAIEDGLRYLWTTQSNRAGNFPGGITTNWGNGFPYADASFVALAFENQGYTIPNDNSVPTGIYEKYVVRRALNYVLSQLQAVNLTVQAGGLDPCVGPGIEPAPCLGFGTPADRGYATAVAVLGFAASGALNRVNTEVAGVTNGMTYGEILQRLSNAEAYGMTDQPSARRGGVGYNFNGGQNDGSTYGWAVLGFLDAEAAGAIVPQWVKDELGFALNDALNTDGSFDYQGNGNPASNSSVGPQKNGIGLQGLFITGEMAGARVDAVTANVNSWFPVGTTIGTGGNSWGQCGPVPGAANHGCAYTMYNNFKGLKLMNIQTLPNVGRPAGPGAIPANDWHEDYKDWLLANQQSPTTTGGGSWGTMGFSCCESGSSLVTAMAELLLSPVTLVPPDPIQFGEIGLQHCLDGLACLDRTPLVAGDPTEDTNLVGEDHTVVSIALSINGDPIPGTTINIDILSGPNAPRNFQAVTNAAGEVRFTYTSNGTAGTDEIQASIGALLSNTLTKVWEAPAMGGPEACDINGDREITRGDIRLMTRLRGTVVDPAGGPGDFNSDGEVTGRDVKACIRLRGTVLP